MKIVVCASLAYSLVNFRGALLASLSRDHSVIACAPDDNPDVRRQLSEMGVGFRRIPMQRASLSPIADLRTLVTYLRLFREQNPDIVLAYTQKPIIYAGIATRLRPRIRFFAMVSGLGHAFGERNGQPRRFLRALVSFLYRIAVRRTDTFFVFNRDDGVEMLARRIIRPDHRLIQLPGSGVDTARFAKAPLPVGPPVFLLIARLMRDKGLYEFVAAARQVRMLVPAARFQLLGPFDDNPESIHGQELDAWIGEGVIEYLGTTS
ncbi:MAG TPA: glycosyltransferase, partial [Sphingomonas sp.]|nr:glycosyltransferase [Sphingomonas sp.]